MKANGTLAGTVTAVLLPAIMVHVAEARRLDNWREIGSVKANHHTDHDRIEVNNRHDSFWKI